MKVKNNIIIGLSLLLIGKLFDFSFSSALSLAGSLFLFIAGILQLRKARRLHNELKNS